MPRHRLLPVAALAAATLALSACGGTGTSTDPYGSVPARRRARVPPRPVAASIPLLAAKDAPSLGTIVTDAEGFTLYRFDKDTAKPTPTTTCLDDCATKWPPVTVDPQGKLALEGVDKAIVGLVAAAGRQQPAHPGRLAGLPLRRRHRAGSDRRAGRQRQLVRDHTRGQEGRGGRFGRRQRLGDGRHRGQLPVRWHGRRRGRRGRGERLQLHRWVRNRRRHRQRLLSLGSLGAAARTGPGRGADRIGTRSRAG